MSVIQKQFPQFFVTSAGPCPYLPGKLERKVFTHLVGQDAVALHSQLSRSGFRRSQNIAYRPACEDCNACTSVRVEVDNFIWSKSFKRVWRVNSDLTPQVGKPIATQEQYTLFRDYIDSRHSDGGMADMSVLDFASMINETAVESNIIEYRTGITSISNGKLIAVALIDILDDGLSMLYSFYDPEYDRRSLGTFMILDTISRAKTQRLPFVYLGYWINESSKMAYKSKFRPQQRISTQGWDRMPVMLTKP